MRLRWFLTMITIVAATAVLTVLVSNTLNAGSDSDDQVISAPGATTATTPTTAAPTTSTTLSAKTARRITGTVTALHLGAGVVDPRSVPTPLTITADRGFGNGATLTGVWIESAPATIEWDAGRPFVLSSGGALVLDPVRVDLTPEGLRFNLADGVHTFVSGAYQLDTPVAVGREGVAGARDSVLFAAAESSTFEAHGDAAIFLDASAPRRLIGPGTVHLEGTLTLTDASGEQSIARLDAAEGAFELTLTPAEGGGWTVDGLLAGDITAA